MKYLNTQPKPIAALVACLIAGNVWAQNVPHVTVTARPDIAEVEIDKFSAVSAVVTEETIRDLHAADLSSALRNTPGTQITRYAPVGSFNGDQGGSIFIRGMGLSRPGSEIKTYIDDVPMYLPQWNHALLDLLPVNGMSDITIYKSPQPQINGNNFASINLNTKTAGANNGIAGNARVSYGSFNTVIEQVDMTGKKDDLEFALAQGFSKSNGQRANSNAQLANIMGSVGFKIDRNWQIGASGMALNNTSNDPGNNTQAALPQAASYDSNAQMASVFIKHDHGVAKGTLRFYTNTGNGNLNNDLQTNGYGNNFNAFTMQGFRFKEEISAWKGGSVIFGLDYDQSTGSTTSTPLVMGTNQLSTTTTKTTLPTYKMTSPYIGVSQRIELNNNWALQPSAGIRNYQNNQYESKNAPYAGLSLISDRITLFANASKGINYPGLEAPALAASVIGPSWNYKNLSPEEMNHLEVGGKFLLDKKTRVDLSLFQDAISNRYRFTLGGAGTGTWTNFGQYTIKGSELGIQREIIPELYVYGGWTYLNNNSTQNLPYVPQNAFNLAVTGFIDKVRVSIDAQYQSSFYSQTLSRNTAAASGNTTLVDGFTIVNMRASYPVPMLGKKGEIFAVVENLFNQQYAYRTGYPMPGTWGSVGLAASF
jgi:iron complex outermembrane receptor protein